MQHWNAAKRRAYEACGGSSSYDAKCFDHWTNEDGGYKGEGYTQDDEYGNRCAAPVDSICPICQEEA